MQERQKDTGEAPTLCGSYDRPLFARLLLPRFTASALAHGAGEHREQLLSGLSGRVIEVGAGDGVNFGYYPDGVSELVAVEPENTLRARAEGAAAAASVPVRVLPGVAEELPVESRSFDAAVASLVLCSVSEQERALGELRRVLRPGGELRFYEHVRSDRPGVRRLQRALDATLWPRLGGGCHLGRDTSAAIRAAGFSIDRLEPFDFKPNPLSAIANPHVLGVARSTAGA